ncbi:MULTISPECIES: M16 family metallopeptidase [Myxococcus]|uniref:M16 family metallopeptidase n=1 Tax=Myxococcus TaxID=32 RepID=UPI00112E9969|nr:MULTISPECIES: pitrilysin family protein [Myxococcus]QDE80078.1 peptidase M16 [Myxococcus xanthus]QDE94391.1 peptidase M16 [Myxococcus xanthus]WAM26521.1 pitrilysin family protein [Myxococcus sp. NMCA1]
MRRLFSALLVTTLASCASNPKPAPANPDSPALGEKAAPAEATADAESFRATPPQPGKAPDLVLPTFQSAKLDNGITVLVSTRRELPLVFAGVAFAAGSAQDPKGKEGLAELTYRMLLEGAGKRDTVLLDNAFADLGVSPAMDVQADGAQVGVRVLTRNLDAAMALLSDVVLRPTFSPKAFERRKKQQLADLVRAMGQPGVLAQMAYLEAVFGLQHPYGHLPDGTPASVQSLTLADVMGFYQKHTGPKAQAIILTGDISLEEGVALAKRHFSWSKNKATPPPPPPATKAPPRQQVYVVPKPGLDQTLLLVGRAGIAAGNPDEYPLELATTVFGGFFGSRLNMNLRENKGYSYGAGASLSPRLGVGPLTAYSSVRQDVTGPALSEVMNELTGLKNRPITAEELEAAREGLIRAFPGAFESVEGLGASAAALFITRRPLDEFNRTVEGLRDASAAEVQRMAEQYLDPAMMQIVLVGDPATIQEQVTPLGLGKLVPIEPDEAPVPRAAK